MYATSTAYAGGTGAITANQGIYRSTAANGMALWTDAGPIVIAVNGSAEVGKI